MSYTREQNIELIKDYAPVEDMPHLRSLVTIAIYTKWEGLPDDVLAELAHLCTKAANAFYEKYA